MFIGRIICAALFCIIGNVWVVATIKDYSDCDSITYEDFSVVYDLSDYTASRLPIVFNRPLDYHFIDDSHFYYTEYQLSPAIRIVDLNTFDCNGYINIGFGQYEMLGLRGVQLLSDDTLIAYDGSTGKLFEFKLTSPMEMAFSGRKDFNRDAVFNITKVRDKGYVFTGNNGFDKICYLIDNNGKIKKSFSSIPLVPREESIGKVYEYDVQTRLAWNDRHKRLVTASLTWDIVSVYDEKQRLVKRMRGPVFIDVILRNNKNVTHVPYPYLSGLIGGIKMSESGFSVGWGGLKRNDEDFYGKMQCIASFDWNGNPLSVIKTPPTAVGYAYDIDSNILLLVTEEADGQLIMSKYNLNSSYN